MHERTKWGRAAGLIRAVLVGGVLAAGVVSAAEPEGPLLLSAERGVDADVPGFNFRAQYAGASVGSGSEGQSLAVWAENRDGTFAQASNAYDLYATRLAADGTPLDAESFALSRAVGNQVAPAVAFDGTQYLVVWQDTRCQGQSDLYGARVKADGTVLDADGFLIATAVGAQVAPRVAFRDGLFLVVWTDGRSEDADIYGARVKPDGTSMDPAGFPIAFTSGGEASPAVAPGPTSFLVTWSTEEGILAAHVDASGRRVEAVPAVLATGNAGSPSLAFDGTRYLVAWVESQAGTVCFATAHGDIFPCPHIAGALLAADGTVVRGSLNLSTLPGNYDAHSAPQVAAVADDTGTSRFLVTWEHGNNASQRTLEAIWVDADGAFLTPVQVVRGEGSNSRLGALGHSGEVVWAQGGIFASRVSYGSAPLAPVSIRKPPRVANEQSFPVAASDGTNAFTVWLDNRNGRNDLYGLRLGPDGTGVGTAVRIASATEETGNLHRPWVAYGGGVYLVVWADDRGTRVSGARVSRDGTLLDATPLRVTDSARASRGEPSVASDGTDFFVVWQGVGANSRGVFGTWVSAQGAVSGTPVTVASLAGGVEFPSVSYQGTQYLVTWRFHNPQHPNLYIFATRVTRAGEVLDPNGIQLGTTRGVADHPISAFDGTNSLVVWRMNGSSGGAVIEGARLSPSGTLLDTSPLTLSGTQNFNNLTPPALTFDGTDYVVAWLDDVYSEVSRPSTAALLAFRVNGARVRPDGTLRDPGGLWLGGSKAQPRAPTLARVGQGTSLLLYHQYEATPAVHALRLGTRLLGNGTCAAEPCVTAPPNTCSATGFCTQPAAPPVSSCPPGTPPEPGPTPKEVTVTPPDGGTPGDGGILADGGVPGDGGVPADGGVPSDGGVPDAGTPGGADGGTSPEPEPDPSGCGCGAAGGPEGAMLLLLGALVAVGRRRRAA